MSPQEFRKLPKNERDAILRDAAEEAAPIYEPEARGDQAWEPEVELLEIHDALQSERTEYARGFLEGRGFEVTGHMDKHPDFWEGRACECAECSDSAADYC